MEAEEHECVLEHAPNRGLWRKGIRIRMQGLVMEKTQKHLKPANTPYYPSHTTLSGNGQSINWLLLVKPCPCKAVNRSCTKLELLAPSWWSQAMSPRVLSAWKKETVILPDGQPLEAAWGKWWTAHQPTIGSLTPFFVFLQLSFPARLPSPCLFFPLYLHHHQRVLNELKIIHKCLTINTVLSEQTTPYRLTK